jgi:hypothetical protein
MTLAATVQSEYRVFLTFTPDTEGTWVLYRTDGTHVAPVRNGTIEHVAGAGPSYVVPDREPPLGFPVTYYALRAADGTRDYSGWVTVPAELPVLSDPITGIYAELTIKEWPDRKRQARRTVLDIPGRDNPIVIAGRMGHVESQVLLRTDTTEAADAVAQLLQTGHTVQLRAPDPGVGDAYLSPGVWTESRVTNDGADVRRYHAIEVTHTDMPNPDIPTAGDTLEELADAVPGTLADIAARWPTSLLEIAQADLSGGGL